MASWARQRQQITEALRSDVSEVRFLPGPRRADVLETGDFGGDKLSGLTRYVEKPRRADVLLGSTSAGCRVRRWLILDTRCTALPCSPAAQQRPRLFYAVDGRAVRVAQRLQRPQPLCEALRQPLLWPGSAAASRMRRALATMQCSKPRTASWMGR